VEIYDGDMRIDTVFVDQTRNGGVWNHLGTYTFSGSARIVVVSESTSATTCADAVKLTYISEPISPAEVIIDNGEAGSAASGDWTTSYGADYYETRSEYSSQVGAEYAFETAVSGVYDLSLWWTEYSNRSTEVPVEIYDGDKRIDTVFVDQTQNGGAWNRLGTYTFSGSARIVVVSEGSGLTTCADAAKLEKK
jgi:hypothetical protein